MLEVISLFMSDERADLLRDDMCRLGHTDVVVVAHSTAGHCTMNPNIRVFAGDGNPYGGVGGVGLARPGTREFAALKRLLKTNWRFKFPFQTVRASIDDISAEVTKPSKAK